jgi:phage terminase small subunit
MPILKNPRHEAFARSRAKGARLKDAYEDAGFVPDTSHACRLASQPEVAERIAELRAEETSLEEAREFALIAALLRVVKAAEADTSPASHKEVRQTLLEVDRLRNDVLRRRQHDRSDMLMVKNFPTNTAL